MKLVHKKKTYIITGATGFMGQKLVRTLVDAGNKVILLVRQKNNVSSKDRVIKLFNFNTEENKLVFVIDCDITNLCSIINDKNLKMMRGFSINGVWHLAANLSFNPKDIEPVYKTNLIGTQNIVKLTKKLNTALFYVSTAYIHGAERGLLKEDELVSTKFNNHYEQSKFKSEVYLQKEKENGLKVVIFRPGILIDVDGSSVQNIPFGYYSILHTVYDLSSALYIFIDTHPILSKILCLKIDENGMIHSKVIPFVVTKSSLNLIPVDIAIDTMISLLDKSNVYSGTFHVVSTNPLSMKRITEITFSELKIRAPIIILPKVLVRAGFVFIHILSKAFPVLIPLSKKLTRYGYYMTNTYDFDTGMTIKLFGEEYNNLFVNTSIHLQKAARIFITNLDYRMDK